MMGLTVLVTIITNWPISAINCHLPVASSPVFLREQFSLRTKYVISVASSVAVPIFSAVERIRVGSNSFFWCGWWWLSGALCVAGSTDWPLSTVSQLSVITAVVAKIKKHVGLTSQMVAYKLATISFTMPELPAVERVRPPSFAMLLTVELVTTLIVRAGGAGWEGEGKRQ